MSTSPIEQPAWTWHAGVSYFRVRYLADDAGKNAAGVGEKSGSLKWSEEIAPEDDDRGNGIHTESVQPLADFLRDGPRNAPPVTVVDAMLASFQAQKPVWYDPYRLLAATRGADVAAVREMLAQGIPPDVPVFGLTPIWEAIRQHNLPLAEMLFAAGVDVNRRIPVTNETILMTLAAYAPDSTWEPLAARMVAQGVDLEAREKWGTTALMAAAGAATRLPGLVPLLLRAGADANAVSVHGYTPLMTAVSRRYTPDLVIQQLLAAGADVNARDDQGMTVLMWAISSSLVDSVRTLVAAGADVRAVSAPTQKYREPKSVLRFAEDYANPEILMMIREACTA